MSRKRPSVRTKFNADCKVSRVSHTTEDEIRSPYFLHDGGSEARSTQGEEDNAISNLAQESPSVLPTTLVSLPAPSQPQRPGRKLTEGFYDQECVALANALLGKVIVRVVEGKRVSARVVETESYLGGPDQASHSYDGKRTPRNEPMYMKPGTSYVYSIYGMYHCFNVSSRGDGACVLVRAAEPLEGLEVMVQGRGTRRGANAPPLKPHQLCNGPSKLCQALALTKESANKLDLAESDVFWMEEDEEDGIREAGVGESQVVVSTRIGIDSYGAEWAKKPLRFYVLGNKCVSVRDKQAEKDMVG